MENESEPSLIGPDDIYYAATVGKSSSFNQSAG